MSTAVAALVAAVTTGLLGAGAAAQRQPALRLVATSPLTVHAKGFQPRELVRVTTFADDTRRSLRTTATRAGRFTARFAVALRDPCSLVVTAVGRAGSRASAKLPQRMCPPRLAPSPRR